MWHPVLSPWWPFLLVGLLWLILGGLAYFYLEWRPERWKAVEMGAATVMAAAAVSIPLVLDRNARDTRTLELLNDAGRKIGEAVVEKDKLDLENKKEDNAKFAYDYITSQPKVKTLVYRILNEYDYICLGGNEGLFSNTIIKSLRWDALDQTWKDYRDYIAKHRAFGGSRAEAWIECDRWISNNPRH